MTDALPLADVTVLELGHIVAGPFCSLLLADLGAEVVKVEHPNGGDAIRNSSPVGSSSFNYVNRDKASVTINLKSGDGAHLFKELAAEADVVVENFAPGTAERLGVGYDDLEEINDELVYCSIKGFNDGPYQNYPALDPVAEAMSGLMSVTGRPGDPPVRSGTSLADMAASFYGALSVVSALRHRDRTGEGQRLNVPLFESTVSLMGYWLSYTQAYDDIPAPLGAGHPNWAPYDVFQTDDDTWVFVGPSSERQWRAFCEALDLSLHEDPRFETIEDRRANRDVLNELISTRFASIEANEVVERLRAVGVPVAPVNNTREVCEDPHLHETDAFATIQTVEGREADVDVPRFPVRSTGFERIESEDPPRLGEDTTAVLGALGYDDEEIAALREQDAI